MTEPADAPDRAKAVTPAQPTPAQPTPAQLTPAQLTPYQPVGIYLGEDRVLTRLADGTRMILDARDIILTPILLLNGSWEPETSAVLDRLLAPGMNFVDVGANVGYFSCRAAARVLPGGGHVWAFEADPIAFGFLGDNLALNWHFSGLTLEQQAVYSHGCELTLHQRRKYKGNTSIGEVARAELAAIGDSSVPVPVKAVALDDYFDADAARIDVIKIDVEGAEPFVLEGMRGLLARQPAMKLLIEWSPGQIWKTGVEPQRMLDFMAEHAFAMRTVAGETVTVTDLGTIGHAMLVAER